MTCRAENRLEDFEFHDAWLTLDCFDGETLVIAAQHVNVHKNAGYEALEHDMELNGTRIIFQGIYAATFEPGRAWKTGADGRSYTDDPLVVYDGKEAERMILEELRSGINVCELGKKGVDRYFISGYGNEPFFTVELMSSGVVLEWDGYCKQAWYELHRQIWHEVMLDTPYGRQQATIHAICHDEDVSCQGKLEKAPLVTAGLKFGGKELWGKGEDVERAFASLQRQLPKGFVINSELF